MRTTRTILTLLFAVASCLFASAQVVAGGRRWKESSFDLGPSSGFVVSPDGTQFITLTQTRKQGPLRLTMGNGTPARLYETRLRYLMELRAADNPSKVEKSLEVGDFGTATPGLEYCDHGTYLSGTDRDGDVHVYNLDNLQELGLANLPSKRTYSSQLQNRTATVWRACAASGDAAVFVQAAPDGSQSTLSMVHLPTGDRSEGPLPPEIDVDYGVDALSPSGEKVAFMQPRHHSIVIVDTASRTILARVEYRTATPDRQSGTLAFVGESAVAFGFANEARIVDIRTGAELHVFQARPEDQVRQVSVSPDGQTLFTLLEQRDSSGGGNSRFTLTDIVSGRQIAESKDLPFHRNGCHFFGPPIGGARCETTYNEPIVRVNQSLNTVVVRLDGKPRRFLLVP